MIKSSRTELTKEEQEKLQEQWNQFSQKYTPATPKEVHNGKPVISKTFRYEETNIYRAHVFNNKLRKFDPYFNATKCLQPFWHATHYFIVAEQIYTAAAKQAIGKEYDRQVAKDVPITFNWRRPILWNDNITAELVREELGEKARYKHTRAHLTILSEKTGKTLSRMSADAYSQPRSYLQDINEIEAGNEEAIDSLIKKIEAQEQNQKRLLKPRKTLTTTSQDLVKQLKQGTIPKKELEDHFSLWE